MANDLERELNEAIINVLKEYFTSNVLILSCKEELLDVIFEILERRKQ